jgi:hypothetical protein
MLRLCFRVYMMPSVVLAVLSCWFGAGLDISKHVLSFSCVAPVFNGGREPPN